MHNACCSAAARGAVSEFLFVRHGETAWNADKRLQGQLDVALNARGEAQARLAGAYLAGAAALPAAGFHALYASDLARAWCTAEAISAQLALPVIPAPAFRERHYGLFQGLTYSEARARHPALYARHEARDPDFAFPEGGESLADLYRRVTAAIGDLLGRHRGQRVIVVTHGGVLDVINRFARGHDLVRARDFAIPNAGFNRLVHDGAGWQIAAWGETAHLDVDAAVLDELVR